MIRIKNPNSSRLPNEYQEVEYIESSGTQYIDTGFIPNQDSSIEMIVKFNDLTINETLYCSRESASSSSLTCFKVASALRVDYHTTKQTLSDFTLDTSTKYTFYANKNKFYINGELKHTFTSATTTTPDTWALMVARNNGASHSNYGKYKLYSCRIWDNGTLIRNFVPCYRLSDNVVGLYDLTNDVFYTNAGTGTFLIGTEVGRRDMNIKPTIGGKTLLERYIENMLVYQKASKQGIFVCVGGGGKSYYSTNGETWTAMSGLTSSHNYRGVAYGNDRFVCVGASGKSYYSTDGMTWEAMSGLNSSYNYFGVTYGNDRFICVGTSGKSYYSTDGMTWEAMSGLSSSYAYYSVTYANGRFVCVGGGGKSYYSTNGTSWTAMSGLTSSHTFYGVTYGKDRFMCVGNQGSYPYCSTNGQTWTKIQQPLNAIWRGVAYGKDRFVCVGATSNGSYGYAYYSTNGETWTEMGIISDAVHWGVAYGKDRFICVGASGKSYYSADGENLTAMSGLSSSHTFYSVAYGEI